MAEKKKRNKIKIGKLVTPIGVARYPHLVIPDTKWKPEGEYKVDLVLTGEQAEALRPKLEALHDKGFEELKKEHYGDAPNSPKAKRLKKENLPLKPQEDEEGNETGAYLLACKRGASGEKKDGTTWKAKIDIVDSAGKKMSKEGLSIWGGSKLRVDVDVMAWFSPKDNVVGLKLEIVGVQIIELVAGGGERESSFGAVEGGYVADEDGGRTSGFSDSDEDDDVADEDDEASADF